MPLHNFHIFSCSHWDLQTHFNVKKKKKHDWTLFWPKELQPNWFLKQIQRLFSWRRADVSDVTDTVPLQTFMCFPVSGTKLLCVIEVIVFFIEDTALKTDFLSHSLLQSLWFKLKLNEFSILVKKKHTHATPVLSLHSFWLSNSCCYIPRPSHGSVCSILSLVLFVSFSPTNTSNDHSVLTYAKLLKRQESLAVEGQKDFCPYAAFIFKLTVLQ